MEIQKLEISITTDYITLDQLLQFAQIADTGAIAKEMLADAIISVNGEPCLMRGKKIRGGDVVFADFEDEGFEITVI